MLMAIYTCLKGKVVVVTGAGRGIGETVAIEFAKQGCAVGLIGRSPSIYDTESKCKEFAVPTFSVIADVSVEKQVIEACKVIEEKLGNVLILINCAGGFDKMTTTSELTLEQWNEVIANNLTATFLCCKYFAPMMQKAKWGRIINFSSAAGRSAYTLSAPHYVAAKAGIIGFTQHLARELGEYGITVNAIAPGTTVTERVLKARPPEMMAQLTKLSPLGRLGTTIDQANVTLFLASEESSYITGACIDVNGGRVMM